MYSDAEKVSDSTEGHSKHSDTDKAKYNIIQKNIIKIEIKLIRVRARSTSLQP